METLVNTVQSILFTAIEIAVLNLIFWSMMKRDEIDKKEEKRRKE